MATEWHWFIIIGTALSLGFFLWLLFSNRQTDGGTTGHEWDGIEELDNPLPAWWVWMFVITIVFAVGYLAFYPGLGNFAGTGEWSSAKEHDLAGAAHRERFAPLYTRIAGLSPSEFAADKDAMQVGRRLFINNCATCHGVNASGAPGFPDLSDDHWIWGGNHQDILTSISNGRQAAMPPWGSALGDSGVTQVANYAMSLAGFEHDPNQAAEGAQKFQVFCVSCHGVEGKGNPLMGAPDITQGQWIYGTDLTSVATTISLGRNGAMPAFGEILGEERVKILAAYIASLSE